MKITILIFLIIALFSDAEAHETHVTEVTNITNTTRITQEQAAGVALGIAAAQHQFYLETDDLQGSIGGGNYEGENAVSFAMAKRFKGILINGSVGGSSGNIGTGVGANWRW